MARLTHDTTPRQDRGLALANKLANVVRVAQVPPLDPLTDVEYGQARIAGMLDSYAAEDIADYAQRVAEEFKKDPDLADTDPAAVLAKVPREKPIDVRADDGEIEAVSDGPAK